MKRAIVFFLFFLAALPSAARQERAGLPEWPDANSFSVTDTSDPIVKMVHITAAKSSARRTLYIIEPKKTEKVLWMFHGYKPAGDPYLQSPMQFISRMKLKELSDRQNLLVVMIDSATSLYRYYPQDTIPELMIYQQVYQNYIVKKFGKHPVILSGVSSGAEGAVKFAPLVKECRCFIGISGTYDFDEIPSNSGEYRIHLKEYGTPLLWKDENPITILSSLEADILLFSEEFSLFRGQAVSAAQYLGSKRCSFPAEIGKGKKHSWDFWASPQLLELFEQKIVSVR